MLIATAIGTFMITDGDSELAGKVLLTVIGCCTILVGIETFREEDRNQGRWIAADIGMFYGLTVTNSNLNLFSSFENKVGIEFLDSESTLCKATILRDLKVEEPWLSKRPEVNDKFWRIDLDTLLCSDSSVIFNGVLYDEVFELGQE
jgi:hypothetical protein